MTRATAQEAEVAQKTRGSLTLPLGITGAVFSLPGNSEHTDLVEYGTPDEAPVPVRIADTLRSLGVANDQIVVEGSGTTDHPWIITIRSYDPADPVTVKYEFVQRMARPLDDSTGPNAQEQWIDETAIKAGTIIGYDSGTVTLKAADIDNDDTAHQAARLQARMRLIDGLQQVTVSYDQDKLAYLICLSAVAPETQTLRYDTGTGIQHAEVEDETRGSITLPLDIASAVFFYQDKSVAIDLLGVAGPDEIRDVLSSLAAGSDMLVDGLGTLDDPWVITVRDYDLASPVTVEYELGNLQALASTSAGYQVIERLGDDGAWAIERNAPTGTPSIPPRPTRPGVPFTLPPVRPSSGTCLAGSKSRSGRTWMVTASPKRPARRTGLKIPPGSTIMS